MQLEFRVQLASGREKWVQLISAAAPPQDGREVRVGVVFDITDRKQAEAALLENSELWKRALESSGDGVWDWHVQAGVPAAATAAAAQRARPAGCLILPPCPAARRRRAPQHSVTDG